MSSYRQLIMMTSLPRRSSLDVSRTYASAACGFLLAAIFLLDPAHAQKTDADFSAYCREKFPNSAYQRIQQSWGTDHVCNQGGTRQNIDLNEACRLTTGSPDHEVSGTRVFCSGKPVSPEEAAANDMGAPDFPRYCREEFPNSIHELRAEPQGPKHYCRQPGATGGFTLQAADLADACELTHGVRTYRETGQQVICLSGGGERRTDADQPQPTPGPGPNGVPKPPAEATRLACQALDGKWRTGTVAKVKGIVSDMEAGLSRELTECTAVTGHAETCRQSVRALQSVQAYIKSMMVWQCHLFAVQHPSAYTKANRKAAAEEACAIEGVLEQLATAASSFGAMLKPMPHKNILEKAGFSSLCNCKVTYEGGRQACG